MKKIKQIIVVIIALVSITSCNSVSSIYYGSKSDVKRMLRNTEWTDWNYSSSVYCNLNIGEYLGDMFELTLNISAPGKPEPSDCFATIEKIKHPQTGLKHYALVSYYLLFIPDTGELYGDGKLITTLRKK